MLRLCEVRTVPGAFDPEQNRDGPDTLAVTFRGPAGEFAEAEITLHMKPRPDDETLLADGRRLLADAIAQLHRELSGAD